VIAIALSIDGRVVDTLSSSARRVGERTHVDFASVEQRSEQRDCLGRVEFGEREHAIDHAQAFFGPHLCRMCGTQGAHSGAELLLRAHGELGDDAGVERFHDDGLRRG